MSLREKQATVFAALAGFGALVAVNYYFKHPGPQVVAFPKNQGLDQYTTTPHPGQDPMSDLLNAIPTSLEIMEATADIHSDTILDRTQLMEDAKRRKPWNMTLSERSKMR